MSRPSTTSPGSPLVCAGGDGGLTFEAEVTVARFERPEVEQGLARFVPNFTFRLFTFAFLGVDQTTGPEGGRLYAIWHQIVRQRAGKCRHGEDHDTRETVDVMIAVSDDRGVTWSRPRRATNLPVGAVAFYPFVSVSPRTGTVNIVYYTNRIFEKLLDVFLIRIIHHGRRFLPDRLVTSVSFDPNAAPLGEAFIGDYIGCAARPDTDRAVAVWCDTRRGNEDIFAAPEA